MNKNFMKRVVLQQNAKKTCAAERKSVIKQMLGGSAAEPEETVFLTLEVDALAYEQCAELFASWGTTVDAMCLHFIMFFADSKNAPLLSAYFGDSPLDEERAQLRERVSKEICLLAREK